MVLETKNISSRSTDDATGQILECIFDKQETCKGYYEITKQFLMNYGMPYKQIKEQCLKKESIFQS